MVKGERTPPVITCAQHCGIALRPPPPLDFLFFEDGLKVKALEVSPLSQMLELEDPNFLPKGRNCLYRKHLKTKGKDLCDSR